MSSFQQKGYVRRSAIVSTILGKFFLTCDGFFHPLSLIKGSEEKKSKNVENCHYPVEKTTIIQEIDFEWQQRVNENVKKQSQCNCGQWNIGINYIGYKVFIKFHRRGEKFTVGAV